MNFISAWGGWGLGVVPTIIAFLFVLTIVVFFHELGHFWVARRCGVRVEVFSIGFGRELLGFSDRHGTRWKLCAIPLGGYVKFFGDADAASRPDFETAGAMSETERSQSFFHKTLGQRAAIVAAGPIANFILAIVIFTAVFSLFGKPTTAPRVDTIVAESAAEAAGFKSGDLVLSIDGRSIDNFSDMQRIVASSAGRALAIVVDRDGRRTELTATPAVFEFKDRFGGTHRIGRLGISKSTQPGDVEMRRYDPFTAAWMGMQETWFVISTTLSYIGGIFMGTQSADQLGGPIRIAQVAGEAAQIGFSTLMGFAALISVSIGLLNLFPIPLLDGGHLVFYAVEAIRGRPMSERAQETAFRIGFIMVMTLMIFATWNDLRGPIGMIFGKLVG
ncbi:RIP metalloprotease RseP [Phreatobacter stygius]|uniref:Zinc metalloprotease n=1 Tax=Phreatobacter stygius TaxID=1940610 RepID=A0A4D7B3R8_9HYPH|nr:RIP metalloprotease RseP [Phreatobacter stygius]QCI68429.1 RIP metalloprotease RseP [Phreatobacter stygius]